MKKPALLILSLSALLTLASCSVNANKTSSDGGGSETSSAIPDGSSSEKGEDSSSSEEPIGTASVKAVYVTENNSSISVKTGDTISAKGTITFTNPDADVANYQILINKTAYDMKKGEDGTTFTFDYEVANDSDVVIAVTEKTETVSDGYTVTYEQGEHYTIFGITSGQKYKAYVGNENDSDYNYVNFAVIPDAGYIVDNVFLKTGNSIGLPVFPQKNKYQISPNTSYLNGDSTITVEVSQGTEHSITFASSVGEGEDDHIDVKKSTFPTKFVGGEQVTFSFVADEGYAITGVSFSTSGVEWDDDYSHYVVTLPDADVTITVTTSKTAELKVVEDEKISNVAFYKSFDSETKICSDPITTSALYKYVYVAFDLTDGYVPTGINGLDDWDYDFYGVLADGRYVYGFTFSSEDGVKFNTASAHKVSLDSSCGKVSISFSKSKGYFKENAWVSMNVTVKDEYASSYSVKSVTYGDDLTPEDYGDGEYCFSMPGEDVTVKVELKEIVKSPVSITNNAGNLVSSASIRGYKSKATADSSTAASSNFIGGERAEITVKVGSDHSKKVKVFMVTKDGSSENKEDITSELLLDVYSKEYSGNVTIPEGGASIVVEEGDAATALNITYPTEGCTLTFYTSTDASSKVDSLPDIYPMDTFYFTVDKTIETGYRIAASTISGYSTLACESTVIDGKTAYIVDAGEDNIDISVVAQRYYNFSARSADGEDASSLFIRYALYGDNSLGLVDGTIAENTNFMMHGAYKNTYEITSVKIGGVESEGTDEYGNVYYTVTGDVEIVVSKISSK